MNVYPSDTNVAKKLIWEVDEKKFESSKFCCLDRLRAPRYHLKKFRKFSNQQFPINLDGYVVDLEGKTSKVMRKQKAGIFDRQKHSDHFITNQSN